MFTLRTKTPLVPAMTRPEIDLLEAYLNKTDHYLEFGCGGSTFLACQNVKQSVTAVDSSRDWIGLVRSGCSKFKIRPRLFHVDIGPIKEWGMPTDRSRVSNWSNYHSAVWWNVDAALIDFCLIDGRFRVACFLQSLLRLRPGARLAIHDFSNRPQYHAVLRHASEIEAVETLSILERRENFDRDQCLKDLEAYKFEPE